MQNPSLPVGTGERSNLLDALRGFALLGVMMDNLFGFSGWAFLPQPAKESLSTWTSDGIIGMLEQIFINGKFYRLLHYPGPQRTKRHQPTENILSPAPDPLIAGRRTSSFTLGR